MKVEKLNKEECVFEPFTIKITIQTIEEFNEMYARLNAPVNSIKDSKHSDMPEITRNNTLPLFNLFSDLREGIKQ